MPRARALSNGRERVPGFDAHERDDLVLVEHGDECGHPEIVRDGGELWQGGCLQVTGDTAGERRHPRSKLDPTGGVARDEPVVLERAQDAVRD